jgi:hypothetical protein
MIKKWRAGVGVWMDRNIDQRILVGQNDGPKTANIIIDWFYLRAKQIKDWQSPTDPSRCQPTQPILTATSLQMANRMEPKSSLKWEPKLYGHSKFRQPIDIIWIVGDLWSENGKVLVMGLLSIWEPLLARHNGNAAFERLASSITKHSAEYWDISQSDCATCTHFLRGIGVELQSANGPSDISGKSSRTGWFLSTTPRHPRPRPSSSSEDCDSDLRGTSGPWTVLARAWAPGNPSNSTGPVCSTSRTPNACPRGHPTRNPNWSRGWHPCGECLRCSRTVMPV